MARIPPSTAAVTASSANIFFTQVRYERALEAIRVRLRRRAVADYSCLPDLVEIGGFQYESGERLFEPWSASLIALLGDAIQPLLQETWGYIPRAAAEKFAALVNGVLSERDRVRIEQAYTRLKFPVASAKPDLSTATGADAENSDASVHQHTCSKCGMPFRHDAWECEPPSDSLCNLCAEDEMGPMPIWTQRWASERGEDGAEAPAADAPVAEPEPATRPPAQASAPQANVVPDPTQRGLAKVAGMDDLKALLHDEVVSALREPDDLQAYGLTIPNGILLFGPPGCGKTYIARQLAEELNFFFKEVFPSEIGSTFIHETTLKIRETFDAASDHAPALLFVDEFEAMVPARRSLGAHQHHTSEEVSEFLKQLESCAQRRIVLIAATNEPWKIDPAVIRTGRLDKLIYVPAPDAPARAAMLRFHLYGRRQCEGIDVVTLSDTLPGYSASDLKLLVDEAARRARKDRRPISQDDLRHAARELVHASVTPREELRFLAFGQRGVKSSSYKVANDIASALRTVSSAAKRRVQLVLG
jgi:ATPase family protein associated with various cellular activities (AAA)